MSAAGNPRPELLKPKPENIPQVLKDRTRWAPWRAEWNAKRGKWDKIPVHPRGYGLSTARPDAWVSFEAALAAYQADPKGLAGVGYLMTGEPGVVGIDLDHCVDGNVIADWAQEVIDGLASYIELSPSRTGLRVVTLGTVPCDWNNHDTGIEVYGGHTARFLTITGHRLRQSAVKVDRAPAGVLEGLAKRYAKERDTSTLAELRAMPDLLDPLLLPTLADLDLPYRTRDFLTDGTTGSDRSSSLFSAAIDLFTAGLADAQVLSILAGNPHAMGIALDHRRQDHDRALAYLWREHCQKGKARAAPRAASADDFEDLSPAGEQPAPAGYPTHTLAELFAMDFPPLTWWWDRYIPGGEVTLLAGHGGAGKSTAALQIAVAVATGTPCFGRATKQGRVIYYSGEDHFGSGLMARASRVLRTMKVDWADVGDRLHIIDATKDDPALVREASGRVVSKTKAYGVLRQRIADHKADLVIVDNASDTFDGDEISRAQVRTFVQWLAQLVRGTNGAVLLLSHVDKNTAKGAPGGEEYSGSSAWHNSVRSRLYLRIVDDKRKRPVPVDADALELVHGKSTHDATLAPLPLVRPHGWALQLDEHTETGHDAGLVSLLRTIDEFTRRGEYVSTNDSGGKTTRSVLGSEAPANLADLLRAADRQGLLEKADYKDKHYKFKERWEVTAAGHARIASEGDPTAGAEAPSMASSDA